MDEADVVAAVSAAEERTRRSVAQLLHDDLQQHLHSLRVRVGMLGDQIDQGQTSDAAGAVAELAQRVDNAVEVLRRVTRDLTSVDEAGGDLSKALSQLVTTVSDLHGLHVGMRDESSTITLDRNVVRLLVDAARELLFNVVKHAAVDRADLIVVADRGSVALTVSNDGNAGSDAANEPTGMGITALRERAEMLGGHLEIERPAAGGTTVIVRVPVEQTDRTEDPDQSEDTASLT